MFTKIQMYLGIATVIAIALFWGVMSLIGVGRKAEKADQAEQGAKESDAFQDRIQAGHEAGNAVSHDTAVGGLPESDTSDPNDRAQRRKSR